MKKLIKEWREEANDPLPNLKKTTNLSQTEVSLIKDMISITLKRCADELELVNQYKQNMEDEWLKT